MARIDIVMPLYNKARCVARAIHSIRAQTMSDWHLIVVDDGSTDAGAQIVSSIKDKRIRLIRQENQGPGAARNVGITEVRAEYLAFLDADDEWYRWYLANSLEALEKQEVSLVGSMYYEWPKQEDRTGHWARRGVVAGRYSFDDADAEQWESRLLFFRAWNSVMRTETARKYDGFYAEKRCLRGEDTVFFFRVGINEDFAIIGPPAVRYHQEDSGLVYIQDFPIPPFVDEPEVILRYCAGPRRELMNQVIERLALRTVHHWARVGLKSRAADLLNRYPGAKRFRKDYNRCRREIVFSRWLKPWVKFKCAVGPPGRRWLNSLGRKLHLCSKIPDLPQEMPDETSL